MGHFLSVVKLVWNVIAIDDGDVGVLGVGFVDQGDGCLVVLCCHSGGCFVVYGYFGMLGILRTSARREPRSIEAIGVAERFCGEDEAIDAGYCWCCDKRLGFARVINAHFCSF